MRIPLRAYVACVTAVATVLTGCAAPRDAASQDQGRSLPLTPPMGWNSWNPGTDLTEQTVKDTIDAMVSSGMRDAGYRYVNLDAGWDAQRGPAGDLQPDPTRFPHGIAALARYAHDRGMLLGLYASPFNER
ncbi:MAG: alpha-galactosidase, partial [Mycobacterium sp.]|nr:alpha-galactosidase [Mycobacterium sp.]